MSMDNSEKDIACEGLIESIACPLMIIRNDFNVEFLNKAARDRFWKSDYENRSVKCYEIFFERTSPCENAEVNCPVLKAIKTKKPVRFIHTHPLDSGKKAYVEIAVASLNNEGDIVAAVEVIHDITDYKKREEMLISERDRLAMTLSSIGDGVIVTDEDEKVILVNKMAEKITQWSEKEALGKHIGDIFVIVHEEFKNEDMKNKYDKFLEEAKKKGDIKDFLEKSILVARDGTHKVITYSSSPVYDKNKAIKGFIYIFRDITMQKKYEDEIYKAKRFDALSLFAGSIAHDVNNILFAIQTNLALVKFKIGDNEEVNDSLKDIENVISHARDLTQRLLVFSKKSEPVKNVISIKDVIKEICAFVFSGGEISCNVFFDDDVSNVEVDEVQIKQVFHNIFKNAKEAIDGNGEVNVWVKNVYLKPGDVPALNEGKYVKVTIQDTGKGIKKDEIESIFDPYFTTKSGGSGLGLSIVYSIIKKHHGAILVDSKEGKGTVFTIYLPVK